MSLPNKIGGDPVGFLKNNIGLIGGALTTAGVAYGAISKIGSMKREAEQKIGLAQTQVNQLSNDYLTLAKDKETVEQLVTDKEATITKLEGSLTSSQTEIEKLKEQLRQKTSEASDFKKMLGWVEDKIEVVKKPEPIP